GRMGDTLQGALNHVLRLLEKRGLTVFDARQAAQRSQAVARTIGVSLDQLTESERARFRDLAVFPGDTAVPLAAVEVRWARTGGLDGLDTDQLLQHLFGLSLLLGFDAASRWIRLHDVIRAYLRRDVGGEGIAQLDRTLVEAYRHRCPDGWAAGQDDGYFFSYLLWHLEGAGQEQEVRSLLLDCAWIEAKLRATGVGPVLREYEGFAHDQTTRLVGQALRLSAHALARDPRCVRSQLFGRIDRDERHEIAIGL